MVTPKYGSKELVKCVENLGFTQKKHQDGTSHIKYIPPRERTIVIGKYPFIEVQMGHKNYDSNACNRYIGQIKKFGYSEEEIIKAMKK